MTRQRKEAPAKHTEQTPISFPFDAATWAAIVDALVLPPQQAKVVGILLHGQCDKYIAHYLGLSVPTVRHYLTRIFQRLGVDDRVQLVLRVFAEARSIRSDQAVPAPDVAKPPSSGRPGHCQPS